MTLKVIGAGFGRTGTMSLKLALEQLGLGPCHHMIEVLHSQSQAAFWERAAQGEGLDWSEVFSGYGSTVDWPSAHYWHRLSQAFPSAKVVLTVRDPENWWDSFSQTILLALQNRAEAPPPIRRVMDMANRIILDQTFGGKTDKDNALAAFAARVRDVREALPPERLLVFDVREGWQPLADFLGVTVPDTPFPRSNSRDEFWEHTKG